jgi:hypothetical protein
MPRFEVLARQVVIGHTELEFGDPPMGVAFGQFLPVPAYASVQASLIAARDASQQHLELQVLQPDGAPIPAQGGVQILDLSDELGPSSIEIHMLGIPYPLYAQLFSSHLAAYDARFPSAD